MNIGEKIRTYRRNCNLTQKELGEKIGVSDKTISSWEKIGRASCRERV